MGDGVRVLEPRKNVWLADTCTLDTAGCRMLPCADSAEACLVIVTTTVVGGGKLRQHVFILGLNVVGISFHLRVFGHRMVGQRGTFTICAGLTQRCSFSKPGSWPNLSPLWSPLTVNPRSQFPTGLATAKRVLMVKVAIIPVSRSLLSVGALRSVVAKLITSIALNVRLVSALVPPSLA